MSVGDREQVLRESLKGRWCSKCRTVPRVAWWAGDLRGRFSGDYYLRCECPFDDGPTLARRPVRAQTVVLGGRIPQPPDYQAIKELFQ